MVGVVEAGDHHVGIPEIDVPGMAILQMTSYCSRTNCVANFVSHLRDDGSTHC